MSCIQSWFYSIRYGVCDLNSPGAAGLCGFSYLTVEGNKMTSEPKRNEGKYLLTERQFWILTAVLAVVIVLITRKLLAG